MNKVIIVALVFVAAFTLPKIVYAYDKQLEKRLETLQERVDDRSIVETKSAH